MPEATQGQPEPHLNRPPTARRGGRWVIRIGAAAFVAFVFCAGWLLLDNERTGTSGARELAAVRARAEADDPDWTWERLNEARVRPPAGKNGAPLIPQIKKLMHPDWVKAFKTSEFASRLDIPSNVRYAPEVPALVRHDLDASADAVRLARTLKDRPFGHREIAMTPDLLGTIPEETKHTPRATDLLRWEVVVAAEDGDAPRTADGLRALVNASRSVGDEPALVSQSIRIATRGVALHQVERAIAQGIELPLAELQAVLAADAEEPLLLYAVRGERAAYEQLFENVRAGVFDRERVFGPSPNEPWWGLGLGGSDRVQLTAARTELLRYTTWCVGVARHPIHEQPPLFAASPAPARTPGDQSRTAWLLYGGVEQFARSCWRSTAEERCAVAGLACERFRQKHNRWPDTLTELVPEFLPAVPHDPFDGEPLRYTKVEDGVVVYSVGDHASRIARPGLPAGIGIGFRLWNPNTRRLPPLPDPSKATREPKP